jgi:hypothetical protein
MECPFRIYVLLAPANAGHFGLVHLRSVGDQNRDLLGGLWSVNIDTNQAFA